METRFILCARRVVTDSQENDVSLIGVLEDFLAQGFPVIMSRLTLVWSLRRDEGEPAQAQGTLKVFIDSDTPLQEGTFTVDFQDRLTTRVLLTYAGFVFPKPGEVRFVASLDNPAVTAEYAFRTELAPGGTVNPVPTGGAFFAA